MLIWLQSSYTNAHVKSLSELELAVDCTVLHQLLFHTAHTNISFTKAEGKGLEMSDSYVHASKCWQCQQASFDGDDN